MQRPRPAIVNLTSADAVRSWLRDTLDDERMSVAEWARLSGVSKATIWRALSGASQFMMSARTLQKLFAVVLDRNEGSEDYNINPAGDVPLPLVYDLAPKVWREFKVDPNVTSPPELSLTFFEIPYVQSGLQWLARVRGDHSGPYYRDGDLVHVVETEAHDFRSYNLGEHIILFRIMEPENLIEVTLRVVKEQLNEARYLLSFIDPTAGSDVIASHASFEEGGITTKIAGIAVALYRPRDVSHRMREVGYLND